MIPSINDDVYVHKRRVSPVLTAPKPLTAKASSRMAAGNRVPLSSSADAKGTSTQPTSQRSRKLVKVYGISSADSKATSTPPTSLKFRKGATSALRSVASVPKLTQVSERKDNVRGIKTRIPRPEATRFTLKSSVDGLAKSPTARYLSGEDSKMSRLPIASSYMQQEKTISTTDKQNEIGQEGDGISSKPMAVKSSKMKTSKLSKVAGKPTPPAGSPQKPARSLRMYLSSPSNASNSPVKAAVKVKTPTMSRSLKAVEEAHRRPLTFPRPSGMINRADGVERTTPPKGKRRDTAARQDVQETAKETLKRLPTPLSPAKGSVAKQQKISTSPLPEPKPVNRRDFLRHPTSGGSNAIGSSASDRIVNPVRVSREISTRTPSRPDVSTKSVNMRDSCPRIVKPVARTQSQRGKSTRPSPRGGPHATAGGNCKPTIVKPVVRSPTAMEICIRYTVGSGGNSGPRIVKPVCRPQDTSTITGEEVKVIRGGKRKSSTNVKAKVVKPVSRDSIIPDRTVSSPGSLAVHKQGRPEAMDEKGIDIDPNDQLNTLANKPGGDNTKDCHSALAGGCSSVNGCEADVTMATGEAILQPGCEIDSPVGKADLDLMRVNEMRTDVQ